MLTSSTTGQSLILSATWMQTRFVTDSMQMLQTTATHDMRLTMICYSHTLSEDAIHLILYVASTKLITTYNIAPTKLKLIIHAFE